MTDRRQAVRIPVQMSVEESGAGGLYFQRSANLSAGGMFLEQTVPHPLGTVVTVKFTLPGDKEPLQLRAEIVSTPLEDAKLGMGLRFMGLTPEQAARIERFVKDRAG